jgi:hypothetical protein
MAKIIDWRKGKLLIIMICKRLELWTARNCLERKRKSHENDNQKVNEEKIKNLLNEEFL